jgi:Tfp pilus assembly protein PilP
MLFRHGKGIYEKKEVRPMKEYRGIFRLMSAFCISGILFLLPGCGGDEFDEPSEGLQRRQAAASKKKGADAAEKEKPVTPKKEVWYYSPEGKRNPFEIVMIPPEVEETKKATRYDLHQMWVDGIIWGAGNDMAHIILPNRDDIFVAVGDELGKNHGRVKQIRENQVVVEEMYYDLANPNEIHVIEKILELKESKGRRR